MKKIFATLLAASLLLIGTQAHAQLATGAGYLFASETTSTSNSSADAIPHHGFYLGGSYNVPIVAGLGVAPGFYVDMLLYSYNYSAGSAFVGGTVSERYTEVALNVPVNLTYSFEFGRDLALRFFAGPVFQYGVMARSTYNEAVNIGPIHISDGQAYNHYDSQNGDTNPFNIYLGGGLGFQAGDLMLTVGYDHNLLDIDKSENTKTNRHQIKAGINFLF